MDEEFILLANSKDTHKLAIKEVSVMFRKKWNTSYQYEKTKARKYQNKVMPDSLLSAEIAKPIFYVTKLSYAALKKDYSVVSSFLQEDDIAWKESMLWDKKGGLCIYASVLLYCLLLDTKDVHKKDVKYMQGYYHHQFMEQHVFHHIYRNGVIGLHAYLELKGYVIDTTIHQLAFHYYPDAHREFQFIAETTPGTDLYGFEEAYRTIHKYAKKFAKEQGLTVEEWIQYHKQTMNEYIQVAIAEQTK